MDFPFLFIREKTSRKNAKKAKNICRGERLINLTTKTQRHEGNGNGKPKTADMEHILCVKAKHFNSKNPVN